MSTSYVRRSMAALLGQNVVYTLYPVIGAGAPVGAVTTGGAANTFGADKELIAAAAITTTFWFCSAMVDVASASECFVVEIEEAGTTHVYAFRANLTAVTANVGPFAPPYPVQCTAGVQISARQASVSGADTLGVSIIVATGL